MAIASTIIFSSLQGAIALFCCYSGFQMTTAQKKQKM
jgi:hypothetical protein